MIQDHITEFSIILISTTLKEISWLIVEFDTLMSKTKFEVNKWALRTSSFLKYYGGLTYYSKLVKVDAVSGGEYERTCAVTIFSRSETTRPFRILIYPEPMKHSWLPVNPNQVSSTFQETWTTSSDGVLSTSCHIWLPDRKNSFPSIDRSDGV